jgi:competence ComEA-like helix-hairpin-helix protein
MRKEKMKRLLKLAVAALVAYVIFRLLVEFFRPMRLKLEEDITSVPLHPEPPAVTGSDKLNINMADVNGFSTLPGIGPKLAERIVARREEIGSFAELDDLTQVQGIGSVLLERLRAQLTL